MGTLDDPNRLKESIAYGLISAMPESDFDEIASLAAQLCQTPFALISIQIGSEKILKSGFGLELPYQLTAQLQELLSNLPAGEVIVIEDTQKDKRFNSHSLVLEKPELGFFAAISLKTSENESISTLCVFDRQARKFAESQRAGLKKLASQIIKLIELCKNKQELERSREIFKKEKLRLSKIIETAEVGTWEWSLDTGEFRYSEKWASLLGYTSQELGLISRQKRDLLLHPHDLEDSNRVLEDYLSGKLPIYQCEVRMKHKSGYWVWILDRGEIISDSGENPGRWMVGTHTDTTDKVVANEQVYIREKRFKILLENSEDAIAILSRDGKLHFETESAVKILGHDPKEISNDPIRKLVHPDDQGSFDKWFQESLDKPGQPIKGNISRVRHHDGTWRYISGTLTNMLGDPVIKGIINNFKDVTEEVLAEERRKKAEKKYRILAQEGADLVSVLSEDGIFQYLSPNYTAYLGFTVEELVGKNAFDFMHPEDLDRVQKEYSGIYKVRQVRSSPFRFRHQGEGWRWVQSVATNLLDDPDIQGIVINSVDVTALIESQKALEQSNERFKLALKAGSECIYDYNPLTHSLFLSETFEEAFGIKIKNGEENFQLILDNIHPEDQDFAIRDFQKKMKDPRVAIWTREYRLLKGNGSYAYVKDRSFKLMDDQGTPIRVVGALTDMSRFYFFQKLGEIEKEFIESSLVPGHREKDLYRNYLLHLEALIPGMKASILQLVDGKLRNYISPNLPLALIERIESLPIGPNQGSCGTAAFLNEKVFVTDVFHDPRWEKFQDLAKTFGIGACWSFPIVNSDGKVVATIANYYSTVKEVDEKELQALERAQRLVSLLMAQFDNLEKIRLNNERYELVNKSTNEAIFDWDVQRDKFHWGESLTRVFGHEYLTDDFDLKKWTSLMHPLDDLEKAEEWNKFISDPKADKWQNQFRFLKKDGSFAFVEELAYIIRNESGVPVRMIGVLRDQTELKVNQLGRELQEKISGLFKEELSLLQILDHLLKILSRFGEFSGAEIWLSGKENTELNLLGYHLQKDSLEEFYTDYQVMSGISLDKGLPGKVWSSQSVQVWEDIDEHPDFLRKKAAKKVGLKTAVGIPIRSDIEMLGVLVMVSEKKIAKDLASLKVLDSLRDFLGREIQRKLQEEELKLFFEGSPDILAILSPNGYFTKVNPAFCQLLGFKAEELTFQPFEKFIHPDDERDSLQEFEDIVSGIRLTNNFINRYRTKSGEYRFISWSTSKPYGTNNFVFTYGKDVTQLKNMEVLLANASKLSRVGGWELDLIKDRQFWSPITCEIHEVPFDFVPSTAEGVSFYREDYREKVETIVRRSIETGEKFDFQAPIITANGNERWVRAIGEAEFVGDKCIRIFGSIQDIHEHKLMEERLKGVSDSIPGVIFQYVLKPDGSDELRYVSQGSKQIWGLTPEECMADSSRIWSQVFEGGDMAVLQKSIQDSAKTLNYWNCEWRVLTPEGKIRWLEGLGAPNKKANGSVVWDSMVMEVTDRKNLENLLEQSARMAKIGSWELDLFANPVMIYWSSTTKAILEYGDLNGIELEQVYQAFVGESRDIARNCMENMIQNGIGFDVELEMVSGLGNSKWVRCIGQALQVNGRVLNAYGSFQDIHDRKLSELNLKSLLLERSTILESIGDGFFAVDRSFIVTYWNNLAERLLRVKREDILGKNIW
ncbi:MAG TPA: PAS domain-containing protein, partial [Algoriphagus sp.]|nr:PAS domain-containing protein [Algoriphagus sp.]